jgi:ABC-2 type transport system ATP-binding protein
MIIQADSLTKTFGRFLAVDHISLQVSEGEIYGFIGLNGAGKTTTIRMLLGMIGPASGSVKLFGKSLNGINWNDVGYLVETPHAYPNLSVKENLEVIALLRKLKDKRRIDDIIEKLRLDRYRNTPYKNLSLGNQQRLGLAKALMHAPQLLILDEPINGLDPAGIVEVRELLKSLSLHGTSIFLSSHILSEVSRLATRIGIIHDGRMVTEQSAKELLQDLDRKLVINTHDNERALVLLQQSGFNPSMNALRQVELIDSKALEAPEHIAALLVNAQLPPTLLHTTEEDLEAYFMRLITMQQQV